MSCRRLAMVRAFGSHQTPLTRVNGREEAVEVRGVGDEDVVEMVVLLREGRTQEIRLVEGTTSLSPTPDWHGYFIRKSAATEEHPTTVEILLSG